MKECAVQESADGDQPKHEAAPEYGPDWVGLDQERMLEAHRAQLHMERQALEEAAEREREEEQLILALEDGSDAGSATKPLKMSASTTPAPRPAAPVRSQPAALIERLRIENLKSFAGPHEIALAPLTLVYGPNSAGKSTLLQALRIFMEVVDAGRHDGIHAWRNVFREASPTKVITYDQPDPGDLSGVSWRPELTLGVDFRTTRKALARAELTYAPYPFGSGGHRTALGFLDDESPSRKSFFPADPDPSSVVFADDYGEDPRGLYRVCIEQPGSDPIEAKRASDAYLFSHPDKALNQDLFALASMARHLGPHRGAPESGYRPLKGPFNIDPEYRGFSADYSVWSVGRYSGYELLNQAFRQLEVPYEFEPRFPLSRDQYETYRLTFRSPDRKWTLRDLRSGAPVHLDEVGYGVSQLLPVIDVCVHANEQVICIEEPELHLHPRLQSRLANLFATSVIERGNQILVETHSESLLLRARRLVRRGILQPSDVAVLYVDNTSAKGVSVRRLRLGDEGELLDPWPTGFFDDSLEDVLGGWE